MVRTVLTMTLVFAVAGCGANVYQLPAPPEETHSVALDPTADAAADEALYIEARRTVLGLYERLSQQRWSEAWELLSNETRLLLDEGSNQQGEAALSSGEVDLDGRRYSFDPVDLFVVSGLTAIDDEFDGETQHETDRRREVFATGEGGTVRKIVVIREGDSWRVHLPLWPTERLSPMSNR